MHDQGKAPEVSPEFSNNSAIISGVFSSASLILLDRYDRQERLKKVGRDVTLESKRIIFLLQRCSHITSEDQFAAILKEAELGIDYIKYTLFKQIANEVYQQPAYFYLHSYSWGLEEFIEALSFYTYLKEKRLIGFDEICAHLEFDLDIEQLDKMAAERDRQVNSRAGYRGRGGRGFRGFGRGGRGQHQRPPPPRSADLQHSISVPAGQSAERSPLLVDVSSSGDALVPPTSTSLLPRTPECESDLPSLPSTPSSLGFSGSPEQLAIANQQSPNSPGGSSTDIGKLARARVLLTPHEYILGITDLTGELMRYAVSRMPRLSLAEAAALTGFAQHLCEQLNLVAPIAPWNSKQLINKVPAALTNTLKMEHSLYELAVRGKPMQTPLLNLMSSDLQNMLAFDVWSGGGAFDDEDETGGVGAGAGAGSASGRQVSIQG